MAATVSGTPYMGSYAASPKGGASGKPSTGRSPSKTGGYYNMGSRDPLSTPPGSGSIPTGAGPKRPIKYSK